MYERMDLTGMRFDAWEVLCKDTSTKRYGYYICKCRCGTIRSVRGHCLRSGLSKSCGCVPKENAKGNVKGNRYDMSGDYGVGYTSNTNIEFYFDLEDFDKIRKYTWRENERGYVATSLNNYDGNGHNKNLFLHQLVMDEQRGEIVDHKNRVKTDCRKSNLQITTQQQNIVNRDKQRNNTTGYVGVSINKNIKTDKGKRYLAYISKDRHSYSKSFYALEDAIEWRKQMEVQLFSNFYIHKEDVDE